ncbi:Dual specificity protein kinase FUZ7 [Hypsizygus marmoreus]|uniref:Dual specificity protein kinase FUZ7 n=1 Tax=Hypsizygus marmoreus TaxID=39966 RepID=A0A369J2M8_HYPMA|nr:dual specificity protein kinase FUZ7 [Hypsizygus marmoreus]RDB14645.1 Dual specificity protein kinase FUZ7 [Hypsizygus marmoreus]
MSTPVSPVSPIRKKRNFKALQLASVAKPAPPPPPPEPEPVAIRQAPTAAGAPAAKKRPPPMTLKAPKIPSHSGAVSAVEQEVPNMLTVISNGPNSAPNTASPSARRNTYHATLSNTLANLDMNAEIKFDLRNEDLKDLQELGQGNGGSVKKVEHTPTGTIMAKKIVLIDAKPSVRKQILRELQIMHDCNSKYIISFWGAFLADPNICICMEFMDKGSLDGIYKKIGPIDIDVVGQVALAVLEGLTYLYDVHRIIHRDIKPSNILCNSRGEIKICDFGVSGELINSIADTFVGTSTYMSPERIQGAQYTVKSDVWSLGISLIELALGRFPFSESSSDDSDLSDFESTLSPARPGSISLNGLPPSRPRIKTAKKDKKDKRKSKGVSLQGGGMTMSILELLQHIVNEPAPRLTPEGRFPREAEEFVDSCLLKDPDVRKTPKDLLKSIWIEQARVSHIDLETWASTF